MAFAEDRVVGVFRKGLKLREKLPLDAAETELDVLEF